MDLKIKIKNVFKKNLNAFKNILPMFIGIILLINLIKVIFGNNFYKNILTNNTFLNSFILNGLGSIMAGNAMISYIIGQEMLANGIVLFLVLVFILAWVNVGFIQLPAESLILDKKFAITRNIIAFLSNFLVAGITVLILGWI